MRKGLIGILIMILVIGIGLMVTNGMTLGKMQISSIQQLDEKDNGLEDKMYRLKQMKEVTFSDSMSELNQSAKLLKSKREEYATLITDSTEGELSSAITAEKYEVEYLWVKLGNYATKNGVTLKLNILNSTTGIEGVYHLEFTLNGKYAGITEFIYEIENDETLGFKIDKFLLVPTTVSETQNKDNTNKTQGAVDTDILTATFTVKDVAIVIPAQQSSINTQLPQDQDTTENTITTNLDHNTVQ